MMVASGLMVMETDPFWFCEHPLASSTLSRLYVNIPGLIVGTLTVAELPEVVVTVFVAPPLIL
ncbi:hypothetical protein DSECCO2_407520 [anaerobic digester metagenome]